MFRPPEPSAISLNTTKNEQDQVDDPHTERRRHCNAHQYHHLHAPQMTFVRIACISARAGAEEVKRDERGRDTVNEDYDVEDDVDDEG